MHAKRQGRAPWHWYAADDSPEEKKLIVKLDLLIVPYAVVAYWIKYIDQSNLSKSKFDQFPSPPSNASNNKIDNAYVSGLQEDLGFHKNQLDWVSRPNAELYLQLTRPEPPQILLISGAPPYLQEGSVP